MSMTLEEAFSILQEKYDYCKSFYDLAANPEKDYKEMAKYLQALQAVLVALRRERVEKVWKGEWVEHHKHRGGFRRVTGMDDMGEQPVLDAPSGAAGKGGVRMGRKEAVTILQEKRDLTRKLEAAEKSADWAAKDRVDSSSLRASQHGRYADALDMAISALSPPNEPLTLEELREMDEPVWVACKPIEGGNGYWCLCQHGHIITPAGSIYNVKEIPHWVFYRRPPEGEDET